VERRQARLHRAGRWRVCDQLTTPTAPRRRSLTHWRETARSLLTPHYWPAPTARSSASDGYKCPGGAAVEDADIEVFPLPAAALAAAYALDAATAAR
jgi:hypothetical protein